MFDQSNFAPVGANSTDTPATFSYKTNDAIGTVTSAGYFADKALQLNEGDIIFIQASDGFIIADVNSNTSSISIVQQAITNRVVVNSATDFPEAVGGVITLEANTEYYIGSDSVNVGSNRFVTKAGTVLSGALGASILISSTTGAMFTGGEDGGLTISGLTVVATSSQIFDYSDTVAGTSVIIISESFFFGDSLGSVEDIGAFSINVTIFDCVTTGMLFKGNINIVSIRQIIFATTSATSKAFDIGTAVVNTLEFQDAAMNCPAGAIGLAGAASSANVAVNSVARVISCEFLGGMTDLETITTDDIRWVFRDNSPTPDTYADALTSFSGSSTETTISTINTPVLVNATWVEVNASLMTTTAAGRVTYIAERPLPIPIDATIGLRSSTGAAIDVTMYIAINGVVDAGSALKFEITGNKPQVATLPWQVVIEKDDYVEVFIENNSNTVNVIVETGILRVR